MYSWSAAPKALFNILGPVYRPVEGVCATVLRKVLQSVSCPGSMFEGVIRQVVQLRPSDFITHYTIRGYEGVGHELTPNTNWAIVHNVCSVVVTPLEPRRATSCGYNSGHPVWHALYECLQDIHGDSSPFLLQPFHELSNGCWPRLTSPHRAIQFVPKMLYRVETGALGGPLNPPAHKSRLFYLRCSTTGIVSIVGPTLLPKKNLPIFKARLPLFCPLQRKQFPGVPLQPSRPFFFTLNRAPPPPPRFPPAQPFISLVPQYTPIVPQLPRTLHLRAGKPPPLRLVLRIGSYSARKTKTMATPSDLFSVGVPGVATTNRTTVSGNTETNTTEIPVAENTDSSLQPCLQRQEICAVLKGSTKSNSRAFRYSRSRTRRCAAASLVSGADEIRISSPGNVRKRKQTVGGEQPLPYHTERAPLQVRPGREWGRGGEVVSLLVSQPGSLRSIPGGVTLENFRTWEWRRTAGFFGDLPFLLTLNLGHIHLSSPSSVEVDRDGDDNVLVTAAKRGARDLGNVRFRNPKLSGIRRRPYNSQLLSAETVRRRCEPSLTSPATLPTPTLRDCYNVDTHTRGRRRVERGEKVLSQDVSPPGTTYTSVIRPHKALALAPYLSTHGGTRNVALSLSRFPLRAPGVCRSVGRRTGLPKVLILPLRAYRRDYSPVAASRLERIHRYQKFISLYSAADGDQRLKKRRADFSSSAHVPNIDILLTNRGRAYLPPTKAIRVQSPAGSLRILACGNRAGRCRWSVGFLGDLPFLPPPLQRCSILTSVNLIGYQDIDVNSHPNLFTHPLLTNTTAKSRATTDLARPTNVAATDSNSTVAIAFSLPRYTPLACGMLILHFKQFSSPPCKAQMANMKDPRMKKRRNRDTRTMAKAITLVREKRMGYLKAAKERPLYFVSPERAEFAVFQEIGQAFGNSREAGKDWLYGFLRRHKDTRSIRKPTGTSFARAMGFTKEAVEICFDLLELCFNEHPYPAHRTRGVCRLCITGYLKCWDSKETRHIVNLTSAERGSPVTIIVCMSAAGDFVPPYMIFVRTNITQVLMKGAPPGDVGVCHPSGWVQTNILAQLPSKESPILLIIDGRYSHTMYIEVIRLARENHILTVGLPPHCTRKIQPLDKIFMGPLKVYCDEEFRQFIRHS
ncbi:hypothetical protein PR048_031322 [Dryococelus australis]|uniref:DDE-1 domain-containing protein n=1 Tax=Dryococelus australis TaxID=614101 RepID=A0ABQ9G4X8_9NEOP|nr:hypothetical protein PR048_031322 [Dryococelus australis]